MEKSKQWKKIPASGKKILTDFGIHKDKKILFERILLNIDTQKSVASKQVRRSVFRGLLRNYFKMTDAQMKPIETTDDQKKEYFAVLQTGFAKQHEDEISKELMIEIMGVSVVCELMIRSGLRIGELLSNPMKIIKGAVYFKLNKKKESKYHKIYIIGDQPDWIKRFRKMKRDFKDKKEVNITDMINKKLKLIIPETFYKRSSHICRAIFVQYINKFKTGNETLPQLITKYLHHENPMASVYYQHVKLNDDVDDFLNEKPEPEPEPEIDI